MADTVRLRKRSGGSGLTFEGQHYSWPEDGAVTEVPYDLAMRLLGVQDGDYSVAGEAAPPRGVTGVAPASVQSARAAGLDGSEEGAESDHEEDDDDDEGREVTEPAPGGEQAVTEPAPPPENDGSPVTPRPRAGTRTRRTAARK